MIFKRIIDVTLIPRHLVEQVPDMDVNLFYGTLSDLANMPMQVVHIIQRDDLRIAGFAWSAIEPTSQEIHVNTVSLERDLQGDGKVLKEFIAFLSSILEGTDLKKVTWATDRPALYERMGFKRSKQIFLEYDLRNGVQDGQEKAGN